MLVFSAAYNLCPVSPRKWLLRRFDQSAIYLLIAATYTPFITQLNDRDLAASLLVALWSAAVVGIVLRLLFPGRFDRLSVVLYIAMGWSGIIAFDKAVASLSGSILTFIATGGSVVYVRSYLSFMGTIAISKCHLARVRAVGRRLPLHCGLGPCYRLMN